jgi:hypothetical protein
VKWYLWVGIAAVVIIAACSKQNGDAREVARVDDQVLTYDAVQKRLDTTLGLTEYQIRNYATEWISSELLYQEAKRRGFDQSEAVLSGVEDARKQLSVSALLDQVVFNDSAALIPAAEVSQYYTAHQGELILTSDLVWISMVVFSEREIADRFRTRVLEGGGWTSSVEKFDSVQSILTRTDSTFYTSSDLYPPELWKVATTLKEKEVSFPVKTDAGFFVILSLGQYKRGTLPPRRYMEDVIRHRLLIDHRQRRYVEFLESLRRRHAVSISLPGASAGTDTLATLPE